MKTFLFILLGCALTLSVQAQWKMVAGGQVFSIYDNNWVNFGSLEIVSINSSRAIICRPFTDQEMDNVSTMRGSRGASAVITSNTRRVYGDAIVLINYRGGSTLAQGAVIGPVQAMLVDSTVLTHGPAYQTTIHGPAGNSTVTTYGDLSNHAVYDVGMDYTPPVTPLTQAQKTALAVRKQKLAVHTFHWLQAQATNGSVSAQGSLGVHYLRGEGTETNTVTGLYWLRKAADSGDLESSNLLVSLSHTNVVASPDDDLK